MELYQLKSFAAVAELGQLTRAAERLHISQPALSAQIKALEDELSVALFERSAGGMALTAAGRQLLPEAERTLAAALGLRGEIAGRVRLGSVGDPDLTRLAEMLRGAVDCYPLLEIDVHHEISGAAFEKVRDGELDAAFYYGDRVHPSVATLSLRELAFRIVVPTEWAERLANADWNAIAAE